VIVRLMGEGQWRVDDSASDEEGMRERLRELAEVVRGEGKKLEDADLSPSEAIVPPEDLSLDEARELLSGEGLIPDLPTA